MVFVTTVSDEIIFIEMVFVQGLRRILFVEILFVKMVFLRILFVDMVFVRIHFDQMVFVEVVFDKMVFVRISPRPNWLVEVCLR